MGKISTRTIAFIKQVGTLTELAYRERLFPLVGIFIASLAYASF